MKSLEFLDSSTGMQIAIVTNTSSFLTGGTKLVQYVDGDLMQEILNRFEFMSYFYNPEALRRDAILQFHITNERLPSGRVSLYLSIKGTQCEIFEGISRHWETSITVSYHYWLNIQAKKVGTARLLADMIWRKDLRVRGNPLLFFKLGTIFGGTLDEELLIPTDGPVLGPRVGEDERPWEAPRKVLILSGSGRSKKQATSYRFASLLAKGISQAQLKPTVEILHLRDLDFAPCKGCFACWRTDGQCVLKDDYASIIAPKLEECDMLVFAFPLYFFDFPPEIRKVITRFFANAHPFIYWNEETSTVGHYRRKAYPFSIFLLGVAAIFDTRQFEIPLKQVELLTRRSDIPFIGSLFRTTSNSFGVNAARTPLLDDIEAAFVSAGLELAMKGEISEEIRGKAEKRFLTPAQLRAAAYAYYHFLNKQFKFPLVKRRGEVSEFDITEEVREKKPSAIEVGTLATDAA